MDHHRRWYRVDARDPEPGRPGIAGPAGTGRLDPSLAHPARRAHRQHAGSPGRCRRGDARHRHGTRLAGRRLSFPGTRRARVGPGTSPGRAGVRDRLRVPWSLRLRRAGSERASPLARRRRPPPRAALVLGRRRPDDARVLSLRLPVGPRGFPRAGRGDSRDGSRARALPHPRLLPGHPADGPPLPGGRGLTGHDGSARRFRHGRHLRLPDAHRGCLSRLVRHVRPHGRRSGGQPAARIRREPPRPRAIPPRARALHSEPASGPRHRRPAPHGLEKRGPRAGPDSRFSASRSSCRWSSSSSGCGT